MEVHDTCLRAATLETWENKILRYTLVAKEVSEKANMSTAKLKEIRLT